MSALIALLRGDTQAAVALFTRICEALPDYPGGFISLAGAKALAGHHDEADALMAQTLARFDGRLLSPYVLAIFATRRGKPDEAFALLGRALLERDPNAMQIGIDPCFQPLHADPRWPALAASLSQPRRP
jgi:predicted Zn-dependent protease